MTSFDITHQRLYTQHIAMAHFEKAAGRRQQLDGSIITGGARGNYGGPTQVHMLKLGSPAIDGVVGNGAPSTDQRDFVRPQGNGYDIGAVERQSTDSDVAPWIYLPLILR